MALRLASFEACGFRVMVVAGVRVRCHVGSGILSARYGGAEGW